ncbi:MAG: hypothetical protein FD129_745 [bacterium]|nr:MAG: hypothetical protein FD129_745 [bacterium]
MSLPDKAIHQLSFPEMYERFLVAPLFQPFAEALLDAMAPKSGEWLLDVACGTGIVARLARQRVGDDARVVGVDSSEPMLAVARSVDPGIDWRPGDAASLPLAEGEQFDLVTCHQGVQFFKDKPAAMVQFRRALAPGGRVAVAAWHHDREMPLAIALRQVAERHLGPITDHRYGFGDATALQSLVATAGFREVRVDPVIRTIRFDDGSNFVRLNAMALVGMSPAAKSLAEEERARVLDTIIQESAGAVSNYRDGESLEFDAGSNVATGKG